MVDPGILRLTPSSLAGVTTGDVPLGTEWNGHDRVGVPRTRRRTGAKALVTDGATVLLVRERRDDGTTFWALPGGGRHPGESFRDCLRREVREELQCPITVSSPLGSCVYHHTTAPQTVSCYRVFAGQLEESPTPVTDEGVTEVRWVYPESPPSETLRPFRRLLDDLADASNGN